MLSAACDTGETCVITGCNVYFVVERTELLEVGYGERPATLGRLAHCWPPLVSS